MVTDRLREDVSEVESRECRVGQESSGWVKTIVSLMALADCK